MSRPFLISEIRQTCQACPSLFEGTTIDGRDVYVKFRYGKLRIEIDDEIVFLRQLSHSVAGLMTYRELRTAAPHMFVFPDECANEYNPAEDPFECTFFARAALRE